MKNKKQRIIEKFIKKDNICNICQQPRKLSDDHVPPQACPTAKSRVISKLLYEMVGDRSFRPRISQSYVYYKTICSECNNNLGSKYDLALSEFSKKVQSFVESSIALPDLFEVECYPNAILRSILGHLLAAKTETDQVVIDLNSVGYIPRSLLRSVKTASEGVLLSEAEPRSVRGVAK
jgi:hypothetical protein